MEEACGFGGPGVLSGPWLGLSISHTHCWPGCWRLSSKQTRIQGPRQCSDGSLLLMRGVQGSSIMVVLDARHSRNEQGVNLDELDPPLDHSWAPPGLAWLDVAISQAGPSHCPI